MADTPEILVVIPARGGSKGIPGKNVKALYGKPLIAWTIDAVANAAHTCRTVVSTDDDAIAEVAVEHGAEAPFRRPERYAGDEVHSVHAVLHALEWLEQEEGYIPDIVVMLLATSPLRQPEDIDGALSAYLDGGCKSVISVYESEKHLLHLRHLHDGFLEPVLSNDTMNVQRQDLDDIYAVNGSIYVMSPKDLLAERSFHVPKARPYVMSVVHSVDINSPQDFRLAEILLPHAREDL